MKKKMIIEVEFWGEDLPLFYMVKAKILEFLYKHFGENNIHYNEEG